MTTFTAKEKELIGTLNPENAEEEDINGNYEVHMINHLDLASELGWSKEAVGAVLGSLEKKFIIFDSEHRGEENCVCWWVHNDQIKEVLAS